MCHNRVFMDHVWRQAADPRRQGNQFKNLPPVFVFPPGACQTADLRIPEPFREHGCGSSHQQDLPGILTELQQRVNRAVYGGGP